MPIHSLLLLVVTVFVAGCGGGDKHLPSSNPPEYDPKKVYSRSQSSIPPDKPGLPRKAAPDPCERLSINPLQPDESPTECGGVPESDERLILGAGGAGGGVGGGSGGLGGRSERPTRPTAERPSYVLEFRSHIVQEPMNFMNPQFGMQLSSNGFDAHVHATVPIRRRDDGEWVGEGVMQYATRTTTQPAQCEIRIQGTGTTTFHVNGGSIRLDPEPFAVKLIILPGLTEEVAETHCTSAGTPEKLKELLATQGVQGGNAHGASRGGGWRAAFNVSRFMTFNWNKQGYEIGGWTQVLNSDVVAQKTMTVNCGTGLTACREETVLTLRRAEEAGAAVTPPR